MAHDYGVIIFAMMPLAMTQNALASIIRADGSPRYSMLAMIVGAVINIVGDPICIRLWGIRGAAIATIVGQFVSFLICAAYLGRSRTFKLKASSFLPSGLLSRRIMALGTSSLLTQLFIVIITVMNNILLVKYGAMSEYGSDIPLSAFVVIMKLFQIVLNIALGIVIGAQPIVGYNYGAKNYPRVKSLLRLVILWTSLTCLVCTVLFEAVPGVFIRMFGSDGSLYLKFAVSCLRIYLSLILLTCVQKVCSVFMQSIGHARQAAPLSALRDVLLIVFSLIIPRFLGVTGVFWAAPIADFIAMTITAFVMVRLWKELSDAEKQTRTEPVAPDLPVKPGVVITISREHGSGGKQIGRLVAEALGIPCYYKEMIALAAKESGLAEEFISRINSDENAVMKQLYLSTEAVQDAITAQEKAIRKLADCGSCVIVGRAADYVLRDNPNVVRVFVRASQSVKIERVMKGYGDSAEAARKNVARADSARAAYYKNISGRTFGDARNYQMILDSSLGIEGCVQAICGYVK